ncbi:MAG TPA: pyridoxal phosphate-dependent aminotransferase [Humidesulfovibrio sp.]|uniref:pyridoxal phosphate-dependent aminotransferase n=1 Tax=Humidesulfovibrio sp. TaxID=2910988 RepID=UPI002B7E237E|nr:pyridoxal phosphate-dependent aminotransferase [Humidesulfovibrio sp.]HWR03198.1 pyridoxal phosphate-dependent aminotransferase [Humidesulfovibrio sp.]
MDLEARLSRRVKQIKISATKEMPMIAAQVGGCVSLGQGIPSFKTPEHVVDAVCRALREDASAGKYSLQPGMPALRRAAAELLLAEKGLPADAEREVAITVGGMEGLLCAMLTLIGPGDEVIVPEPFYPSHVEQILMAEGTPVFAPLRRADWSLDPEAIEAAVTPRTKAIIISSPHNPTGAVWAKADLLKVAELAIRHGVFVICDDTYDALTYDGEAAFSLSSLPELRHLLIGVFSFSKRFALTGWRVGFLWAREALLNQMLKIHDAAAICAPTPAQIAALASLTGPQDVFLAMKAELEKRRNLICQRLSAMAGMSHVRPKGAFYVMAKVELPQGAVENSRELAIRLIREAKVITIPGGAFGPGGEGHVRLSFGGDEAEINEACDRLAAWSAQL